MGANLPSKFGSPRATLRAVRPKLENSVKEWISSSHDQNLSDNKAIDGLQWRWSPLFETDPVGGPCNQPTYINAVVLVDGSTLSTIQPSKTAALLLLKKLLKLEQKFGRLRSLPEIRWGPRCLDIDLLAWGGLQIQHPQLTLPHPYLIERDFVVVPLAAALTQNRKAPRKIAKSQNWPE